MNGLNPKVNGYLRKNKKWQQELEKLRRITAQTIQNSRVKD
jgi:hypothetical protein